MAIVNAYLPEGLQRHVFRKQARALMHNPRENKIGKSKQI